MRLGKEDKESDSQRNLACKLERILKNVVHSNMLLLYMLQMQTMLNSRVAVMLRSCFQRFSYRPTNTIPLWRKIKINPTGI